MRKAFDKALRVLRTGVLCLLACCTPYNSANACQGARLNGIIFDHVPDDIDAPEIIEATIYDKSFVNDAGVIMWIMNARVDRVIKGSIDTKSLTILVYPTSCSTIGIGHGIVLGTLRDVPQRGLMLEAVEGGFRMLR
ncbi:hypothetical protein [Bradyrhizobium sp. CCBAU 53421]|uniref:hypothetical protein n=1 Tax=Bradyrhizobium sp. CCBAU 53421 TaxID=1325120 RepID=UPI00188CDD22|nr:hypothetical protein [Bradyrhizobium sp. CCBAU 53421]QOZ33256.1 hypothetical protein XH92_17555 [Bradyrhizobium sp. CCBAU 53421]